MRQLGFDEKRMVESKLTYLIELSSEEKDLLKSFLWNTQYSLGKSEKHQKAFKLYEDLTALITNIDD